MSVSEQLPAGLVRPAGRPDVPGRGGLAGPGPGGPAGLGAPAGPAGAGRRPAAPARPAGARSFAAVLPPQAADAVPAAAAEAVLKAADRLLRGEWEVLGVARTDLVQPDWFADPVTGRRAPADRYAFRINHRSEEQTGNIKQVWEISRLHHLTLLATAWYLSQRRGLRRAGRGPAALVVAGQPVPVRGALDQRHRDRHPADQLGLDPAPAGRLAAGDRAVRAQRAGGGADPLAPAVPGRLPQPRLVGQQPRDRRGRRPARGEPARSPGTPRASAGGARPRGCWSGAGPQHVPVRASAGSWPRTTSASWPSSALVAAVEAAGGRPPAERGRLAAAGRDDRQRARPCSTSGCGRPARVTATTAARWCSTPRCRTAGRRCWRWATRCFGRLDWWPAVAADAAQHAGRRAGRRGRGTSPAARRSARTGSPTPGSPCCGPAPAQTRRSGAGATAARTASSASPRTRTPTRCRWRSGTAASTYSPTRAPTATTVSPRGGPTSGPPSAHNTVELDGQSQSAEGGPFLWLRHAKARETEVLDTGDTAAWTAEHDGYLALDPPARHRRSRPAGPGGRRRGDHRRGRPGPRPAPGLSPRPRGRGRAGRDTARGCAGRTRPRRARPRWSCRAQLRWSLHRGEADPILGWYSGGLGHRVPAITLLGEGRSAAGQPFVTRLEFAGPSQSRDLLGSR